MLDKALVENDVYALAFLRIGSYVPDGDQYSLMHQIIKNIVIKVFLCFFLKKNNSLLFINENYTLAIHYLHQEIEKSLCRAYSFT